MPYKAAKISFDGSHYIATPKENFPQGRRRRKTRPLPDAELDKKEQFETAYTESKKLPRKERKTFLLDALKDTIPDKAQREEFIAQHTERKKNQRHTAQIAAFQESTLAGMELFLHVYLRRQKAHRRNFPKVFTEHTQTPCKP